MDYVRTPGYSVGKISCVGDEYRENEDGKRLDSLKKGLVFLFSYKNMNMEKAEIYKIKGEGMVFGGTGMAYLWGGMLLIGIVYGVLSGNMDEVTKAFVSRSGEAVSLCISMAGITAMWTGMMKIAENSGLVTELAAKMRPLIRFLFPKLDTESKAAHYICLNFLSNVLGLSWASTSSGLCAMKELKELQLQKENAEKNTEDSGKKDAVKNSSMIASNEMCTFLIINVSSLQLIPVNMIAYRAKYGSADPTAIVGPAILATAVSTAVAVIFCRIAGKYKKVSP